MKTNIRWIALVVGVSLSQACFAQAPASAPAGSTGMCNDGTYSTAAARKGACRGHKGVKEWYAESSAAPAKSPAATTAPASPAQTPASTPASKPAAKTNAAPAAAPAPGDGAGKVWLNTATNVYHCEGTKWYGTTKAGAYMTEAEAKAKGAHADHGKTCN